MKRLLLLSLLLVASCYLFATELTLNNLSSINSQIVADRATANPADVYVAESGTILWWDATLQVDFDLHIQGESTDWIGEQASPSVFVPIPDGAGTIYQVVDVLEGGSLTIENCLFSGTNATEGGDILGGFITEHGATEIIVDNCSFSDMSGNVMEINSAPDLVSITNCIMINCFRPTNSPWGGHLGRFNTPGAELIIENNTFVNHGRLLGNGGNFYTSNLIENHNSWINGQTNAQEIHWNQALMANNIFYNWSFLGRTPNDVAYNYSITTFETFSGLELDSVSVYWGANLLYRDPAIKELYDTNDSLAAKEVSPYITWNLDVDSTIIADDNTTIGKSYWDIDPEFTTGPDNLDGILGWIEYKYDPRVTDYVHWGITSPVTYGADGQPVLSWPPAFDLSYSNVALQGGATDGLPVGDLNWFPEAKATYLANRDAYIAALADSITDATALYIPGDAESERITADDLVAVKKGTKAARDFDLSQNYPNPFNPTTTFSFKLAKAQKISMKVYDVTGKLVTTVIDNKAQSAGAHSVTIDMAEYSSGVYFTVLNAGSQKLVRKMTFVK